MLCCGKPMPMYANPHSSTVNCFKALLSLSSTMTALFSYLSPKVTTVGQVKSIDYCHMLPSNGAEVQLSTLQLRVLCQGTRRTSKRAVEGTVGNLANPLP